VSKLAQDNDVNKYRSTKTWKMLRRILKRKKPKGLSQHPDFPKMGNTGYQDVLTALERVQETRWYVEIGSRTGSSLEHRQCNFVAVDPEFHIETDVFNRARKMIFCQQTSDEFFEENILGQLGIHPELAFIDGLHLFEFALRDFINLERNMNSGGVICMHDVCPFNYEMTTRDLNYLKEGRAWTGDVWKTVAILLEERPDLDVSILDARKTGLAVIKGLNPDDKCLEINYNEIISRYIDKDLTSINAKNYYNMFELIQTEEYIRNIYDLT
jgi:hypothetical protein